ncbi:putative reverse transcriptase domain-containing protein, partial [Tanacetum coccineum]
MMLLIRNGFEVLSDLGMFSLGVKVVFGELVLNIVLMPVELGSFDVIIDMDWLANHHAVIVYDEKIVRIPYGDEVLIVQGDRGGKGEKSKLSIISCTKTQKYIKRGCLIFLAQVMKNETEDKSKEEQLEDMPTVQDFLKVFPEDLPGLPPTRQVLISTKEEPTVPIPLAMIGLLVDWWLPVVDLKSTIASRSSKHRMQASNLESVNEKDKERIIKSKRAKTSQNRQETEETSTREKFEKVIKAGSARQQEKKVNEDQIEVKGSIMTSLQSSRAHLDVDWWLPVVDLKSTIASRSSKHRMQASNLESVNEKDKDPATPCQTEKTQFEFPLVTTPKATVSDQRELQTMVDAIAAASQREAEAHE